MSSDNDPSWIAQTIGAMGAAVTALATWAWTHTHKRINDRVEKASFKEYAKARGERLDKIDETLSRHEEITEKLFDKIEELNDQTSVKFSISEKENRIRHEALLSTQTQILVAIERLKSK